MTLPQYVELRLLRYVVAVAEELHFTRASQRVHVSTPSLSRQIRELEDSLGYRLFERKTRTVELTAAGAAFVEEARQALVHASRAIQRGYRVSQGDTGIFCCGCSPWFSPSLLIGVEREWAERLPNMQFRLRSADACTQVALLLDGTIQAGVVESPLNAQGLHTQAICREELVMALPVHHRLSGCPEIHCTDLIDEPFIFMRREAHPDLYDHLLDTFRRAGFSPKVAYEIASPGELLDLVSGGVGVGLVKQTIAERLQPSGVVYRHFANRQFFVETGVAHLRNGRSPGADALVSLLQAKLRDFGRICEPAGLAGYTAG